MQKNQTGQAARGRQQSPTHQRTLISFPSQESPTLMLDRSMRSPKSLDSSYATRSSLSTHSLKSLTGAELNQATKRLTSEERRITLAVLHHLAEIESRMLHTELGYPSLFAYCTTELKYSESAANRRIQAMRALKEHGELESKIRSGDLSLSVVAQARAVIRAHEKETRTSLAIDRKSKIYHTLVGCSRRQAERILVEELPSRSSQPRFMSSNSISSHSAQPELPCLPVDVGAGDTVASFSTTAGEVSELVNELMSESVNQTGESLSGSSISGALDGIPPACSRATTERALSNGVTRVTIEFTEEEMQVLNELKLLRSAQGKRPDLKAIVLQLAQIEIRKRRKARGLDASAPTTPVSNPPESNNASLNKISANRPATTEQTRTVHRRRRALPNEIQRKTFIRAGHQCEFVSPITHKRCSSTHSLEIDHIRPIAMGGLNEPENLRVLCRAHNQSEAIRMLGCNWNH